MGEALDQGEPGGYGDGMTRIYTKAPSRKKGEDGSKFVIRYLDWLAEPHRKRLGVNDRDELVQIIRDMAHGKEA